MKLKGTNATKIKVFRISKSKLMTGIKCSKSHHLIINYADPATESNVATQALFDQGHAVGIEARVVFECLISGRPNFAVRAQLKERLSEYCRRETIAMVNLGE